MVQMLVDRGEQGDAQIQPPAPAASAKPAPGAPIPDLDIAADIARQLIVADRLEAEARAAGAERWPLAGR